MKNKKGFTLVELLAIIVILAVIMVIAVPKILDVVNGSKSSAWKDNVGMIKKAIVTNSQLIDVETGTYKYSIDKLCSDTSKVKEVVKLEDTTVTCSGNVFSLTGTGQFAGKSAIITCTNKNCSVSISNGAEVVLAPGLYDSSDNLIASWDELINTYHMDLNAQNNNFDTDIHYYYINQARYNLYLTEDVESLNSYNMTSPGWIFVTNNYNEHGAGGTQIPVEQVNMNSPAVIFQKNANLYAGTKLVIPGTIKTIPKWSFGYCDNLEEVIIQEGVQYIENTAFGDCCSLKKVTLPEGLLRIGNHAFESTLSLEYINIPSTVDYIGSYAIGDSMYFDYFTSPNLKVGFTNPNNWKTGRVMMDNWIIGYFGDDPVVDDSILEGGKVSFEAGHMVQTENGWEEATEPEDMDPTVLSDPVAAGALFKNIIYADAEWAKLSN